MILKEEHYKKYFGDDSLFIRSKLVGSQWKVAVYRDSNERMPNKNILDKLHQFDWDCPFNVFNEKLFIRSVVGKSFHDILGLDEYYAACYGNVVDYENIKVIARMVPDGFGRQLIQFLIKHNVKHEQIMNPHGDYDIMFDINEYFEKVILKSDKLVEPNIVKEHFISFNEEDGECSLAISDILAYNEYIEFLEAIDIPFSTGGMVGCYILKYNQEEYFKGKLDYEQ